MQKKPRLRKSLSKAFCSFQWRQAKFSTVNTTNVRFILVERKKNVKVLAFSEPETWSRTRIFRGILTRVRIDLGQGWFPQISIYLFFILERFGRILSPPESNRSRFYTKLFEYCCFYFYCTSVWFNKLIQRVKVKIIQCCSYYQT